MARTLALVLLLAAATVITPPPRPVLAEDAASVRAHIAAVAAEAARNDAELSRLNAELTTRQAQVDSERLQLKALARVLYEQPDNPLLTVVQSPTIGDAVTRVTDIYAAAYRAQALKQQLDADLREIAAARARALDDQKRLADERRTLNAEYARLLVLEAGSTATAPPPATTFTGSVPDIVRQAWAPLGAARAEWAIRLAQCESGLSPYAVNRSSGAAGLFQFLPSTWAGTPWRSESPFDPSANASAAAWLYARYGAGQWSCTARVGS